MEKSYFYFDKEAQKNYTHAMFQKFPWTTINEKS